MNVTCSDVSVWVRNFWKMLENVNVDGERFKNEKSAFKCIRINVDVARHTQLCSSTNELMI